MVLAQEEARLLGHGYIGTEHFLLGLIHEGEGVGAKVLEKLGVTLEAARTKVEEKVGRGTTPEGSPPFTVRTKKLIEFSLREALQLGHNYIGTEHLLLGLVREGEGIGAQVLRDMGVVDQVRQSVMSLLSSYEQNDSVTLTVPLHVARAYMTWVNQLNGMVGPFHTEHPGWALRSLIEKEISR